MLRILPSVLWLLTRLSQDMVSLHMLLLLVSNLSSSYLKDRHSSIIRSLCGQNEPRIPHDKPKNIKRNLSGFENKRILAGPSVSHNKRQRVYEYKGDGLLQSCKCLQACIQIKKRFRKDKIVYKVDVIRCNEISGWRKCFSIAIVTQRQSSRAAITIR